MLHVSDIITEINYMVRRMIWRSDITITLNTIETLGWPQAHSQLPVMTMRKNRPIGCINTLYMFDHFFVPNGSYALIKSIQQIHFPDSMEALEHAQRRMSFDELFLLLISL